jgi:hypothetical protein
MSTIFISVASFRDKLCPITLASIFNNAKHPFNIFVGVYQQNSKDDIDCTEFPEYNMYSNQIKIQRVPHTDARGPVKARYYCSLMADDQDFFMQIDSHSLFCKNWDTKLLNMNHLLEKKNGHKRNILSHYPKCYLEYNKDKNETEESFVPRITRAFFNERGMISYMGSEYIKVKRDITGLVETAFLTGGFIFSRMSLIKHVPYDPDLDYLFIGEEILHSARCWTSGYNIFNPNENIVYHFYTRSDEPKIWTDFSYDDTKSHKKVKTLLGLKNDELEKTKFGMGVTRSLQDYFKFAGIDIYKKRIFKNFCKPNDIDDDINQDVFIVFILIFLIIFVIIMILYKINHGK